MGYVPKAWLKSGSRKRDEDYTQLESLHSVPSITSVQKPRRRLQGWRAVAATATGVAAFVFLFNFILLIVTSATTDYNVDGGMVTIYQGSCETVTKASTASHFIINILGSCLLAASSACMQCLTAPTRAEIDRLHAKGRWVDIGVSSVRNLRFISNKRRLLWLIVLLTSLPLHLMYNSTIFPETSATGYVVAAVTSNFGPSTRWSWNYQQAGPSEQFYYKPYAFVINEAMEMQQRNFSNLVKLSPLECINTYNATFMSTYRNLLIVLNTTNESNGLLYAETLSFEDSNLYGMSWICWGRLSRYAAYTNHPCDVDALKKGETEWVLPTSFNWTSRFYSGSTSVDHCLAEPIQPQCSINLSQPLLVVVTIFNALKCICFGILLTWTSFNPLVTVGDAISSFMTCPDATTKGYGALSALDVRNGLWGHSHRRGKVNQYTKLYLHEKVWVPKRLHWFRAASWRRWLFTTFCCFALEITGILLLWLALEGDIDTLSRSWREGLGALDLNWTIIYTGGWSTTSVVLFANLPQLLVSFAYVFYNGLFTSMLLGKEYSEFGEHRKTLRVSHPAGAQRSTYWLQVPYRYGLPMLITFMVLHYFISQSIFLASIKAFGPLGMQLSASMSTSPSGPINTAGYSPIAILFTISLGALIISFIFILGFCRRYGDAIPMVSSCSAAISATCHPPKVEDIDATFKPVKYGCLEEETGPNGYPRLTFSSRDVTRPARGIIYE